MKRQAFDTINGFYYQFLHTIKVCLETFSEKNDSIIICEGKEDIDCITEGQEIQIQVKASKNKINISKESFKKSILNFYRDYLINDKCLYFFHTNATPCGEVINRQKTNTFEIWDRCFKKDWSDSELNKNLLDNLKIILQDYLDGIKEDSITLDKFDEDFLKKVSVEFNQPDSSVYESIIKEMISSKYPQSTEGYRTLLYLNLLNFIIKKSIESDLEKRKIDYNTFEDIISKSESMLENSYKDIVIVNEDRTQKLYLNELLSISKETLNIVADIGQETDCLTNNNLIEEVDFAPENGQQYSDYPFVTKLVDANIPPEKIFDAKNFFYQTEYALTISQVFSSNSKTNELTRLKKVVKNIYQNKYWEAKDENLDSGKLLRNVYDIIMREHNNTLSSNKIRFDYFHKYGLMHHVANDDKEIIWTINK